MTRTFSLTCAVLGLLLMANIAAPGQAPPSTYYPAWFDGFPFFLGGEGVSPDGLWSFHWSSPPIKDEFQFGGCDPYEHCYFWWYGDLSPGGSFTLAGPDGWVFNGIFLRHGTFSGDYRSEFGIETGDEAFRMELTGQWNNGVSQVVWLSQQQTGLVGSQCCGEAVLSFPSTSTPEPTSLLLIGSGIVGIAGTLRRKRIM